MDGNESFVIYESSDSTDEVLDIGLLGGIGLSILLGSIATSGLITKGIFIYYIKYAAPKERPVNTMIFYDQILQFVLQLIISIMIVAPIAVQVPMIEIFEGNSCYFYWATTVLLTHQMAIGGFGMAIYRVGCIHNLFPSDIEPRKVARIILVSELGILVSLATINASGVMMSGWENAVNYQFCMDMEKMEVEALLRYKNLLTEFDLAMILRLGIGVVISLMLIGELTIYVGIAYYLWNHDKRSQLNKTITVTMRKERNQKNVITLGGQAFAFFVEIIAGVYVLFHMKYTNLTDPSTMSIVILTTNSIVSLSQLVSSHELKRYLKTEWNIRIPFGP